MGNGQCRTNFFTIYRGDDVNQQFVITVDGLAIDLSAVEEISIKIPNQDGQTCMTATKTNGKIVLGGPQGTIYLRPSAADTLNLQLNQQPQDIDIVITDQNAKIQTYRCANCMVIVDRTC